MVIVGIAIVLVALAVALVLHAKLTYDDAVALQEEIKRGETVARPDGPASRSPAGKEGVRTISRSEVVRLFHKHVYDSQAWRDTEWLEVRTLQNPIDLWSIQEIVLEIRPDFIIETGTFHGGTALYLAMVLETIGGDGKVLTIDIEPHVEQASAYEVFQRRVEVITGSCVEPAVVAPIAARVAKKKVMVLLDSAHQAPHVLNELRLFGPLVSEGSYLVVQDTNLNGNPVVPEFGPGPWEAVQQYLGSNPGFEIDREREKFDLSFFPRGFLRRIAPAASSPGGIQ